MTHHSKLGEVTSSFTVTVPIAIFVLGIWWIALRGTADRVVNSVIPLAVVLILLDPILPIPFATTAAVMTLVVAVLVLRPPLPQHAGTANTPPSATESNTNWVPQGVRVR